LLLLSPAALPPTVLAVAVPLLHLSQSQEREREKERELTSAFIAFLSPLAYDIPVSDNALTLEVASMKINIIIIICMAALFYRSSFRLNQSMYVLTVVGCKSVAGIFQVEASPMNFYHTFPPPGSAAQQHQLLFHNILKSPLHR